jgi:NAD(P)-dependent dehydrogenase (short-subunit alcohol dehydrogenase family)
MSRLANKISLVIGGVGGIGGAISQRFASEGAQVYATSRKGAESTSEPAGMGNILAIRADASNNADLQRVFEQKQRPGMPPGISAKAGWDFSDLECGA